MLQKHFKNTGSVIYPTTSSLVDRQPNRQPNLKVYCFLFLYKKHIMSPYKLIHVTGEV